MIASYLIRFSNYGRDLRYHSRSDKISKAFNGTVSKRKIQVTTNNFVAIGWRWRRRVS